MPSRRDPMGGLPAKLGSAPGTADPGSIEFAPLSQSGGGVSLQAEAASRPRHQRHQIVRMNKFIPKARVDLGIEYLFEPRNDDLVSIGVTKLFVIGKPKIGMMTDAHIDRDQRCTQGDRRGWQK